ncbi:putative radical SAM protein YgiQ [Thioalkalivibrio sp. ALE21]|uniref:YgiQ family radical SAM protein n=1 Tax=Thioalkalivibrio sp. ALE21 TaxID=1158175 RepID=UPI000D874609|nr:YgiQ family radical SAM protein [Thioalkalivibrio sp. ALE21]PYF99282.1 putative radical SAM protein YgiQ [Thioalkalivibrio sp. ALE21]
MSASVPVIADETVPGLFDRRPYWAKRFGTAPFLPTTHEEMDQLGWDSCDIVLVTGDAYVDHPSFGMAIIGRLLEAQGFRVGIIAQPDWTSAEAFRALGRPNLFFGVTAGNMDSMVNHYTAERKKRSNDAYTPGDVHGRRPDRAVVVYSQRVREAFRDVPVVIGGIEASLRRIAHYDYWQDKVRRSVLLDSRADILLFGNAERALVELAHRVAGGEHPREINDLRGTAFLRDRVPGDHVVLDSSEVDTPGPVDANPDPYAETSAQACATGQESGTQPGSGGDAEAQVVRFHREIPKGTPRSRTVIRLPAFEQVKGDAVLYAHASRVMHLETNPGNARALVQRHGDKELWLNPPPVPLSTPEMDAVFDLPYARAPHPSYGDARIPAWEMIRFSVNIMRGCFGGCTFCSITEHEGRIIQSRSEDSILREIEEMRDRVEGFTGVVSDLGGPTANMYRLACKDPEIEKNCRRLSCVYPGICSNLNTDHAPLIRLYRKARELPGVKKVLIASGLRYDLAIESPEYVKELVTHHVGGYLKIAPEHTEEGPLGHMMKPGMGTYDRFKAMFEKYSKAAGKEQYLIPYFIAAHPGTTDEDMLNLALWLKRNGFRADQVQAFLPSPMALATAMWHTGRNPLRGVRRRADSRLSVARGARARRLHKAFLRYHDPDNWPLLRDALKRMGRRDLIGNGKHHLIPTWQPAGTGGKGGSKGGGARPAAGGRVTRGGKAVRQRGGEVRTQHLGVEKAARPAPTGRKTGRKGGPKKGPGKR